MGEYRRFTRKEYPAITIPWEMIVLHERQVVENHFQNLVILARRGGLSRCEACAILEDHEWRSMSKTEADIRLAELVAAFQKR